MPDTFASAATKTEMEMLTQHAIDEQEAQLLPARNCLDTVTDIFTLGGAFFGPEGAVIGYAVGRALEPIPVS